jgi:hypothetical protein
MKSREEQLTWAKEIASLNYPIMKPVTLDAILNQTHG